MENKEYRIKENEAAFELKIADHILDNVYGHIGITFVERKLERLPLFKRLHNISQLGFTNLIFPCALHNRYVHSIGVMHMASEMVRHINENVDSDMMFSDMETQIVRLAGMLHDIGHYPMSHNIEQAYKLQSNYTDGKEKLTPAVDCLKDFIGCPEYLYPGKVDGPGAQTYRKTVNYAEKNYSGSSNYHHEAIGRLIIVKNASIRKTIIESLVTYTEVKEGVETAYIRPEFVPEEERDKGVFSQEDVERYAQALLELIGAIVIGNYEYGEKAKAYSYAKKYSAMVQIIHSELDADNIDYLLRDSTFSGTSYGFMDISVLLSSLTMAVFRHKDYDSLDSGREIVDYLVGVKSKAVGCVDQFFQNKYLAYTQMIMSKYVSALEFMLLHWARVRLTQTKEYGVFGAEGCNSEGDGLLDIVCKDGKIDAYLKFTDAYIMTELFTHYDYMSASALDLCKMELSRLTKYSAFDLDKRENEPDDSDISCAALGEAKIAEEMKKSTAYDKFRRVIEKIGSKSALEIKNTDLEKELYSFRFEEYAMTKQLPFGVFYDAAFLDDRGEILHGKEDKQAFQNHFYRLSNGIPIITQREYDFAMDEKFLPKTPIPDLVVDCPNALLHNTYQQMTVYLRRYKIETYQ